MAQANRSRWFGNEMITACVTVDRRCNKIRLMRYNLCGGEGRNNAGDARFMLIFMFFFMVMTMMMMIVLMMMIMVAMMILMFMIMMKGMGSLMAGRKEHQQCGDQGYRVAIRP